MHDSDGFRERIHFSHVRAGQFRIIRQIHSNARDAETVLSEMWRLEDKFLFAVAEQLSGETLHEPFGEL